MPLTEGSAPEPNEPPRAARGAPISTDRLYSFALATTRMRYALGDLAKVLAQAVDATGPAREAARKAAEADRARRAAAAKLRAAQTALAFALADAQVRAERGMPPKEDG
jgi:hypothetical protein